MKSAVHQTKKDRIVDELRLMVATGQIGRGERMPQDELAQRFGSSITPVREALRQLEAEGLLESEPGRGVRVVSVDLERAKSLYIARRLLETHALERASLRVSARDLARAADSVDELAEAADRGDVKAVWEANRRFHFGLYQRAELPTLTRMIEGLWTSYPWDLFQMSERFEQNITDHKEIVAALRSADLPVLREAIGRHIARGYMSFAKRFFDDGAEPPDPFALDVD